MPKLLPKNISEFHDKNYWNDFFIERNEKPFEWYGEWDSIKHYIQKSVDKKSKILFIGCGNSNLSSDMYDNGYTNQINIDYSSIVIEEMKNKNLSRRDMQFICMDATEMTFEKESFDFIIDKVKKNLF